MSEAADDPKERNLSDTCASLSSGNSQHSPAFIIHLKTLNQDFFVSWIKVQINN